MDINMSIQWTTSLLNPEERVSPSITIVNTDGTTGGFPFLIPLIEQSLKDRWRMFDIIKVHLACY
jgi:hypothetical protein